MDRKYLIGILVLIIVLISGCTGQYGSIPIYDKNPLISKSTLIRSLIFNSSSSGTTKVPDNVTISYTIPKPVWLTYSDKHFSTQYPNDWTYDKTGTETDWDVTTFWSPNSESRLAICSSTKDTSLNLEDLQNSMWDDIRDFKIISTEKITFNGAPAYKNVYTWTDENNIKETTMLIISIIGKRTYVVYYMSDKYYTNVATAQIIINNVRINKISNN